jgi:hypothetical protein
MKEMTKKILEAGLVDKTVAQLLARWFLLSPEELGIAMQPKAVMAETLEKFLENIEELLDRDPSDETTDKPMRETRLELLVTDPADYYCPNTGVFTAVRDQLGRLIVSPNYAFIPGDEIWTSSNSKPHPADFLVTKVEKIYQGEFAAAFQLTIIPNK